MSAGVDRRGFLRIAAGAAAGVAGLGLIGCDVEGDVEPWDDAERAAALRRAEAGRRAALFATPGQVGVLGQRYLAFSAQDRVDVARGQLDGLVDDLLALPSDEDVVGWLDAAIADDFDVGRSQVLEGWVMSVTELELCMLLHLQR